MTGMDLQEETRRETPRRVPFSLGFGAKLLFLAAINGLAVFGLPRMIEEVIHQLEDVREAAVIGEPARLQGEVPVAFVSLAEDYLIVNLNRLPFDFYGRPAFLARMTVPETDVVPWTQPIVFNGEKYVLPATRKLLVD